MLRTGLRRTTGSGKDRIHVSSRPSCRVRAHLRQRLLHQVCGTIEILGGERVPDRVRDQAASGEPGAGALMQIRHLFGVLGEQTCVEHVGEQVVVAVPGALGVERDNEEVSPLEVRQRPRALGAAGDGVAQRAVEPVEDGGAEQEVANLRGLPGKNLVGQVVDDEPVATGERLR